MAVARGALIAVADADDESLLHRLEHQVDFLDRNPDVCLLGGGMIRIDERGNPIDDPILSPIFDAPRKYREELLRGQGVMLHGAMMFRRRVLDRVKGYGAYTSSGDFEFILRASRYFQMHNLQEALIRRRVHEGSLTQTVGPTLRGYHHLLFTLREYQWLQREIGRLEKGKGSP